MCVQLQVSYSEQLPVKFLEEFRKLASFHGCVVDSIATTSLDSLEEGESEEGESENNFVIIISNKICTTIRVVKWVHGISPR